MKILLTTITLVHLSLSSIGFTTLMQVCGQTTAKSCCTDCGKNSQSQNSCCCAASDERSDTKSENIQQQTIASDCYIVEYHRLLISARITEQEQDVEQSELNPAPRYNRQTILHQITKIYTIPRVVNVNTPLII